MLGDQVHGTDLWHVNGEQPKLDIVSMHCMSPMTSMKNHHCSFMNEHEHYACTGTNEGKKACVPMEKFWRSDSQEKLHCAHVMMV